MKLLIASLILCGFVVDIRAQSDWLQWGGPSRNFTTNSKGLAAAWPSTGPKRLWSRPLGAGHSAILVSGNTLYTMYNQGEQEVVIALAADTGKTIWEYKYDAPSPAGMDYEFGVGPHSTPLLVGGLLYTVGATGKLFALDKITGKVAWAHDLWTEYGGTKRGRGYSCSPIAYKNTVILTLGGPGQALIAFNQKDGTVAWKNQTLDMSPSSPIIVNVDGQDQLIAFLGKVVAGIDPNNGNLLWSHPHVTEWGLNISTPIWGNDNLLFISSAYSGGSRVLKLTQKDGKTTVEELWFHRRMRLHHSTAIRIGDYIYGSSGDFGPAFLAAVNVKTGEIAYQDRSFPKSNLLLAEGKLIILDEDGNLALATATPTELKVISKVSVMRNLAWTVPTLVGTKLYLRDRHTIMALDLS
ncbi:MAG TPA: PQQ-binding-like beta-propeller repeat protein [Pyrinomonadaceae bacterium]|jgi:outer membrane protein assembly factor BamB|nr:PQQ-binding-like beta-propeller repeat protein [Pyrinomonadaceae bacterium]